MSDSIKHECGIAFIRLRKPLDFYLQKYGTALYGLNKLYLLMEKQHNRGQDGAGLATIKLQPEPGKRYISRLRSNAQQPIKDLFEQINSRLQRGFELQPELHTNAELLKQTLPYTGELLLGHLRYGTHGGNSLEYCHPFLRQNNWLSRNLLLAGNFNFTNVDEQFDALVKLGQHPKEKADTVLALEKIGHFLDEENIKLFEKYRNEMGEKDLFNGDRNIIINQKIHQSLDIAHILRKSAKSWDGGFNMAGMMGHGDAFVMRDAAGIRPSYFYADDEVVVSASERPAIQTAFDLKTEQIQELSPGQALIVRQNGSYETTEILKPAAKKPCSFERIYFSRGSDTDIYKERKKLGALVTTQLLQVIDYDIENTVFSYIPNTAEIAFYGMIEGVQTYLDEYKIAQLLKGGYDADGLKKLMSLHPRIEKATIKDAKLRTFITSDNSRSELVAHVYDITYGIITPQKDNLVIIDDSIVRGTTLRESIIRMLDRLKPKKLLIISSAPQIRYPDCYGIDMSRLYEFVAFQAAIALLQQHKLTHIIDEVYDLCKNSSMEMLKTENFVKKIYEPFVTQEISNKIAELITPPQTTTPVTIIYQSINNLHEACPDHQGDWYFSGDYPTPGGNKVANQAFVNFYENRKERAY